VVKLAEARLLSHAVAVPKFIIDELHDLVISSIDDEKNRGVRGLNTISELKKIDHIDFLVIDSQLDRNVSSDEKMLLSYPVQRDVFLQPARDCSKRPSAMGFLLSISLV